MLLIAYTYHILRRAPLSAGQLPYRRGIPLPSFSLSDFLPGGKEGTPLKAEGWFHIERKVLFSTVIKYVVALDSQANIILSGAQIWVASQDLRIYRRSLKVLKSNKVRL